LHAGINPESANAAQVRLEELASRNTQRQLTPQERAEYEAWVSACDLVAILAGEPKNGS